MATRTQKEKKMVLNKTAGFRPKSQELVDAFNLALETTGSDLSELCELAIQRGLDAAVNELVSKREAAEERWHKIRGEKTRR